MRPDAVDEAAHEVGVVGRHEPVEEALARAGAHVLVNGALRLPAPHDHLAIVGLDGKICALPLEFTNPMVSTDGTMIVTSGTGTPSTGTPTLIVDGCPTGTWFATGQVCAAAGLSGCGPLTHVH